MEMHMARGFRSTAAAGWLLLVASPLFNVVANAASVTCDTPRARGAVVDSAMRCAFFAHYEPDDKTPDPRVAQNLKLKPGQLARSIALVVGISLYQNEQYDAHAARGDVKMLKYFLIEDQQFDEVIVLENENATFDNIRYFLRKYAIAVVSQRYSNKFNWFSETRSSEACGCRESS
jgi:hypothetical protein